jgi:hypothetical protein
LDPSAIITKDRINQGYVIALNTKDENGNWVKAVDKNVGGGKKFVFGPWNKVYPLGTYGVDPNTHTAWAVVNYNGNFAVLESHQPLR